MVPRPPRPPRPPPPPRPATRRAPKAVAALQPRVESAKVASASVATVVSSAVMTEAANAAAVMPQEVMELGLPTPVMYGGFLAGFLGFTVATYLFLNKGVKLI
mmetsp:Transcript_19593/g.66652  ORF Transcript_19593/g.66652 Transcript_19593/m.66652 type:complete len:103 (-) Transcript_19593:108-416(-)